MKKGKVDTVSPYIVYDHDGSEIHHFQFTVIKLWEIPTETLFEQRFKGLLPLAPLTRDGQQREVVEKMITGLLDGNANKDLLSLSYGLASLALKKMDDQEWLQRRFRMLDEILNETWAFKELRQRGMEEGLEKARQQDFSLLSSFVQARFPILMPLAEECRQVITSNDILQQLILKVTLAPSEDEAKQHLLAALTQ